jgi:serine O-acetyltransferase
MDIDLWTKIQDEIKLRVEAEPSLGSFLYSLVLSQKDLIGAVASILASKLHSDALSAMDIKKFILEVYRDCEDIEKNLEEDIKFFKDHDPACKYFSTPLLFVCGTMNDTQWHYFFKIELQKYLVLIFTPLLKLPEL